MSQQINLYDPALLRRREWFSLGAVVAVSAVALLAVAGWGTAGASKAAGLQARLDVLVPQVRGAQEELIAATKAAVNRLPDPALEHELSAAQERITLRNEILALLGRDAGPGGVSFAEYLRALARQAGGGVWLTGFSVRADGSRMEIHGRMLDASALPDYIRRLGGEKAFHGQSFAILRIQSGTPATRGAAADSAPVSAPFAEFSLVPQPEAKAPAGAPPAEGERR